MKRLVQFPLDQGGSVLVEIGASSVGPATRGLGNNRSTLVEKADKKFEDARRGRDRVRCAAECADRRTHRIGGHPSQLQGFHDLAAPQRRGWVNGSP